VAVRLPAALALGAAFAAVAGVAGLLASYHWDVAAGASVALAAVALFASTLATGRTQV
jgi:ABC-type Mn2+/Zn2+ transport system permease subunit